MKFEIEIDGVNTPIEDVENAIKDILYNQLDMELGVDYNKFNVNVNHLNDKHNEKIVKESRKPHMWAVDFRNIHGLFYGADRKEVQSFYNNLKDLNSEEMDGYELEDLMNAYDSIKMIDEINFSRIGRLDSGRYGIEIDDVEYWIINYVAEDLYMESTKSDSKMKFKKIVKESEGGDAPRIYVGTYAKYNDGSIDGEWVDLTDFDSYDEFVEHCRELHKDEKDPEFMIQDSEGFPSRWYHESGLPSEEEFDKIIAFSELDDSEKNAYDAYLELDFSDDSIEAFHEYYYGTYDGD